jgi:hypothetical protein
VTTTDWLVFRSVSSDEDGGNPANIAASGASNRIQRDVRAADLQEEMPEQRFSVPSAPTKTAATQRTSQRAARAIEYSAMREQL